MTDKNYFKIAARRKTRFPSNRGDLTAEQLYDLNLGTLDSIARLINGELRSLTEDSFVEVKPDPRKGHLSDALELVKEIIADKVADRDRAEKRAKKASLKQAIGEALARKKNEELTSASAEELQKQLDALDNDDED